MSKISRSNIDPNLDVLGIALEKVDYMTKEIDPDEVRGLLYNLRGFLAAANEHFITAIKED